MENQDKTRKAALRLPLELQLMILKKATADSLPSKSWSNDPAYFDYGFSLSSNKANTTISNVMLASKHWVLAARTLRYHRLTLNIDGERSIVKLINLFPIFSHLVPFIKVIEIVVMIYLEPELDNEKALGKIKDGSCSRLGMISLLVRQGNPSQIANKILDAWLLTVLKPRLTDVRLTHRNWSLVKLATVLPDLPALQKFILRLDRPILDNPGFCKIIGRHRLAPDFFNLDVTCIDEIKTAKAAKHVLSCLSPSLPKSLKVLDVDYPLKHITQNKDPIVHGLQLGSIEYLACRLRFPMTPRVPMSQNLPRRVHATIVRDEQLALLENWAMTIEALPNLKILEITNAPHIRSSNWFFDIGGLLRICDAPNLTHYLEVGGVYSTTSLVALFSLPKLKCLTLERAHCIEDSDWVTVIRSARDVLCKGDRPVKCQTRVTLREGDQKDHLWKLRLNMWTSMALSSICELDDASLEDGRRLFGLADESRLNNRGLRV